MISYEDIIVLSFILIASFLSLKIDQERNTCNSFFISSTYTAIPSDALDLKPN